MVSEDINFKKIFSALITPMFRDGQVNYEALEKLVNFQLSCGVEGFYCCGSSGEGLLLSSYERKRVLETVIESVDGRVPVISHVGTILTSDAIDLATHACSVGANAISMIPPYYYKFSMEEIIGYYEDVIEAAPDIGVIIYNIPQFTNVEFNTNNAGRLLENPSVIGVKHTSNNLYSMERMHSTYPNLILFNGFDEQFLGALSMGAESTIGTTVNIFPQKFIEIRNKFKEGKLKEARQMQQIVNSGVEIMASVGIFNATKYLLEKQGIECGSCRRPFKPLTNEQMKDLDSFALQIAL